MRLFCKKKDGLHAGICEPFSFKFSMITDNFEVYYLIPDFMIFTFIQGHSCKR